MHSPSLEFLLLLFLLLLCLQLAMPAGSRGKGAIGSGGKAATGPGGPGVMSGGGPGGAFAAGRFSACGGVMDSECNDSAAGERLVKRVLLCGYDRTSRPVRNDSTTTRVNVAVSLFHILDTDEKHQTFTVLLSVRLRWKDEYLTWSPADFNATKAIHIPATMIWTPDIVIHNSADETMKNYLSTNAIIDSDGNVMWMFPTVVKVTCMLEVQYFPFDNQACNLKFLSWTYNGFQVDVMHNRSLDRNYIYYQQDNQEWNVSHISALRTEIIYGCCIEPYPDVTITIHIQRRSLFYIFNLIFPCLLMYMASFLGFFLPIESGEKVNLELTILLALVVFLLIIMETLPPTPDAIPLLGMLFGLTMIMVSVALVMGVIVTNVHVKKYAHTPMPRPFRFYVRHFHCSRHRPRHHRCWVFRSGKSSSNRFGVGAYSSRLVHTFIHTLYPASDSSQGEEANLGSSDDGARLPTPSAPPVVPLEPLGPNCIDRKLPELCNGGATVIMSGLPMKTSPEGSRKSLHRTSHLSISDYEVSPVLQRARRGSRRQDQCICDDPESWVLISRLIDRIFFWLFFFSSISMLAYIFLTIPLKKA